MTLDASINNLPERGALPDPLPPSEQTGAGAVKAVKSPGFWQVVIRDTVRRWGARLGIGWIVILCFFACFAPFLANSCPAFLRSAKTGALSSPMWQSLSPVDLALALVGVVTLACLAFRTRVMVWAIAVVIAVVVGGGVGAIKGVPPTVIYDAYRQQAQAGEIKSVVWAPIPFSPNDRNREKVDARNRKPFWRDERMTPTEGWFLLGTERDGADVASRLIHASRVALAIGLVATSLSAIVGAFVGGIMGYYAGWTDILCMRFIEIFEAVPRLMLLLAVAAIFQADILLLMVLIGLTGWMGNARFVRAEFLRLRKQDFVQAAQALGLPTRSIIFRHLLPNGLTPLLVSMSFSVAGAILIESTLAFLGIGKPDQPSWGQLLNQARAGGEFLWWIAIFPGLMIFLTVFAYTLVGEALRDALDPKLKKRE